MADRYNGTGQGQFRKQPKAIIITDGAGKSFRQSHSPESTHLKAIMALLVSTGILLLLTGITITTTVVSLVFFAPIIIITSPIWVPISILMLFTVVGLSFLCGLGLAAAAAVSWLPSYF